MEQWMEKFFGNPFFKIGFWLFILSTAPLLLSVLLLNVGMISQNANLAILGRLFFFTFPPALLLIAIGAWQVLFSKK